MDILRHAAGFTPLPNSINRLLDLAYNLWWTWHPEAQDLYRNIDPELWEEVYHNPVRFLREVRQVKLDEISQDSNYIQTFHKVLGNFESYMIYDNKWYAKKFPDQKHKPIAYFSAEFGLHECLPIYSGGLGVLSGDHTKGASDLGIPLVGVGFLYPQGYFRQVIPLHGTQESIYQKVRFSEVPALPVYDGDGKEVVVSVQLPGRMVHAKVWDINVGNMTIYLMDTDINPNAEGDRELSARLYGGDKKMRLAQEMVLGIGGIRALRQIGIEPAVYHMNEGHSAFLVLERVREYVKKGLTFDEATKKVKSTSVFTTHTPVPAGHDAFSFDMMEKFFVGYWDELDLSKDEFLGLARQDKDWGPEFSMTVLAMRLSGKQNGVSKLHGEVSRKMWQWLWPKKSVADVPITHVTNGVHTESWLAPELKEVFDGAMGKDWVLHPDDREMWDSIDDVPDETLWEVRNILRAKTIDFVRQRTRNRWHRYGSNPHQLQLIDNLLDKDTLTIGFARRFATYKRATMLFTDVERLKRIMGHADRPIQFIFSGKAHPRDEPGKALIREVYHRSFEPGLEGKLIFVEDYDINVGRYLVSGVDVWLNTPIRPQEASGTSGQKAGLNGIPNLSISDGWWPECYNGKNGWVIGTDEEPDAHRDAHYLYTLLEEEVAPLFYTCNDKGIPEGWLQIMRESIKTVGSQFSMARMLREYVHNLYMPLLIE